MRGEMEPDGSGTRDSGCRTSIDVINSRKRTERLRVDRYGFGLKSGLGDFARVNPVTAPPALLLLWVWLLLWLLWLVEDAWLFCII